VGNYIAEENKYAKILRDVKSGSDFFDIQAHHYYLSGDERNLNRHQEW
jgi:hypothetical protein